MIAAKSKLHSQYVCPALYFAPIAQTLCFNGESILSFEGLELNGMRENHQVNHRSFVCFVQLSRAPFVIVAPLVCHKVDNRERNLC